MNGGSIAPAATVWLISAGFGMVAAALAAGAVIWLRGRPWQAARRPSADRSVPWRACRPLLAMLQPVATRSLRAEARRVLEAELASAGGPEDVSALEVRSVQWLGVISLSVLTLLVMGWPLQTLQLAVVGFVGCLGWWWPRLWLRGRIRRRQRAVLHALPFTLDMMTLCLEGGLHFQQAVQQVVTRGPAGPLRDELERWLLDVRAGQTRAEALRLLARRLPLSAIRQWVQVLVQADALGMSLGPVLRAQADQRRVERFLRAEKLALQAPVKMLMPLILCIFPCTFLIIGFPVAMRMLEYFG